LGEQESARRHARVATAVLRPVVFPLNDLRMEIDMNNTLLAVGIGAALLLSGTLCALRLPDGCSNAVVH
jgi:hypothetical protein